MDKNIFQHLKIQSYKVIIWGFDVQKKESMGNNEDDLWIKGFKKWLYNFKDLCERYKIYEF